MDRQALEQLAGRGLGAEFLPEELPGLAAWCRDWCEASGDARYCVLADALAWLDDAVDEQGVPKQLIERINAELTRYLPAILELDDIAGAASMARILRERIQSLPWSLDAWVAEGWASRG